MAEVGDGGGWWWRWLVVAVVGGGGGWWWRWLVVAVVGGGGGWWWRWLVVAVVGGGGGWWWRWLVVAVVGDGGGWIGTLSVDAGRADVGRAGGHSDDPLSRPRNGHDEAMRQRTLDLLLVSVLAGSAGLTAPVMRSSQQSTPCGSARAASLTGLTSAGRVAWRTTLPHPQDSGTTAEIVAGGTVYADLSGAVTAVNESNGRIRWSRALGTEVHGEWLIGRTLVVDVDQVGRHAQVVGLNPTSGALDWRYRPGGDGLYADPVPAGDVGLVIIASSHELGLVDAASGRLRWHHWTASPDQPVTDGTTVAVAAGNTMRGFAVATGDLRWTRGGIDSSALPTLDEGVVAIGSQVTPDQTPIAG
jgi:hypothetical protein